MMENQQCLVRFQVSNLTKKIKRIEINKGVNVRTDEGYRGKDTFNNILITYDCFDIDGNPMTIRYEVLVKKLN